MAGERIPGWVALASVVVVIVVAYAVGTSGIHGWQSVVAVTAAMFIAWAPLTNVAQWFEQKVGK